MRYFALLKTFALEGKPAAQLGHAFACHSRSCGDKLHFETDSGFYEENVCASNGNKGRVLWPLKLILEVASSNLPCQAGAFFVL